MNLHSLFFVRKPGIKWNDRGDHGAFDFTHNSLTEDGAFHDMDLSAIIGSKKCLVMLRLTMKATTEGPYCQFRTNGNVNVYNCSTRYCQLANRSVAGDVWVETDDNGVIEYKFLPATWTLIYVLVGGWFD